MVTGSLPTKGAPLHGISVHFMVFLLVSASILLPSFGCQSNPSTHSKVETPEAKPESEEPNVLLLETVGGNIEITLDPVAAPKTVAHIKKLVRDGFYNGTTFHRVVPDLLIQGGDPLSQDQDPYNDGNGNCGKRIRFEENNLRIKPGAVAMARESTSKNSASCQFFIALKENPVWQGQYTIFGTVTSGLENARKISHTRTAGGNMPEFPLTRQVIKRITFRPSPVPASGV